MLIGTKRGTSFMEVQSNFDITQNLQLGSEPKVVSNGALRRSTPEVTLKERNRSALKRHTSEIKEYLNPTQVREPTCPTPFTEQDSAIPSLTNVGCIIIDHEIEKKSSHNMRFQNIRKKMPESYFVVFLVEVTEGGESDIIRRRYAHFKALHANLRKKFPRSTIPQQLPYMKQARFDNAYLNSTKKDLNEYIQCLLRVPEVIKSEVFHQFLDDNPLSDSSENDIASLAPYLLLQSYPVSQVDISKGQAFVLTLNVNRSGAIVTWQFTTRKHDIAFSVYFNDKEVHTYSRETSQHKEVKGFYTAPSIGKCTLTWDNSYSWHRPKRLSYRAEVLDPDLVESMQNSGNAQHDSDNEKSPVLMDMAAKFVGTNTHENAVKISYFDRSSSHVNLSPKRLVYAPFSRLKRRKNNADAENGEDKSGFLIIELGRKFRTRCWYKKWFILEVEQGILSFYDQPMPRGAKTKNSRKISLLNANLAIAGNDSRQSPTPYRLTVECEQSTWHLCVENEKDYHEWREAISSAILWVQCVAESTQRDAKFHSRDDDEGTRDCIYLAESPDEEDIDDEGDEYHGTSGTSEVKLPPLSSAEKMQSVSMSYQDPFSSLNSSQSSFYDINLPTRSSSLESKVGLLVCVNSTMYFFRYASTFLVLIFVVMVTLITLWKCVEQKHKIRLLAAEDTQNSITLTTPSQDTQHKENLRNRSNSQRNAKK